MQYTNLSQGPAHAQDCLARHRRPSRQTWTLDPCPGAGGVRTVMILRSTDGLNDRTILDPDNAASFYRLFGVAHLDTPAAPHTTCGTPDRLSLAHQTPALLYVRRHVQVTVADPKVCITFGRHFNVGIQSPLDDQSHLRSRFRGRRDAACGRSGRKLDRVLVIPIWPPGHKAVTWAIDAVGFALQRIILNFPVSNIPRLADGPGDDCTSRRLKAEAIPGTVDGYDAEKPHTIGSLTIGWVSGSEGPITCQPPGWGRYHGIWGNDSTWHATHNVEDQVPASRGGSDKRRTTQHVRRMYTRSLEGSTLRRKVNSHNLRGSR